MYPSSDTQLCDVPHHNTPIIFNWFLNRTMSSLYSNGHKCDQNSIQKVFLGCSGTGDLHRGHDSNKSATTVWCCHVNMDQNFRVVFPAPC